MIRQIFGVPLCALLLALGVPVDAQQPKKTSRVGYLAAVSAAADAVAHLHPTGGVVDNPRLSLLGKERKSVLIAKL
jgi:hypothetical protein